MSIILRTHVLLRIMRTDKTDVLRLPKKHRPKIEAELTADDAKALVDAQSVRNALVASLIVIVVFSTLWVMLTSLIGTFFPWLALLLGAILGMAVRRAGLGLDWRFPTLAAVMGFLGSLAGTIIVAAANAAPELEVSTMDVLTSVTSMTWSDYFGNVLTPAFWIVALASGGLAAFFANRKLSREEILALRKFG
ncbi:MAG: hypothetical protein AAF351_01295 [Pseudomonadota bacterium]